MIMTKHEMLTIYILLLICLLNCTLYKLYYIKYNVHVDSPGSSHSIDFLSIHSVLHNSNGKIN